MVCSNCGRENAEGAQNCAFCGGAMGPPVGTVQQRRDTSQTRLIIVIVVLVVGVMFLVVVGMLAAIMFPVFAKARGKAQQAACLSNVKQLAMATMMYAQDYDQVLPLEDNWCDALMPYTTNEQLFQCPSLPDERGGYGYNAAMSGISPADISDPQAKVILFDATGGWNLSGGEDLVDPRHEGRATVGFMDGHVQGIRPSALDPKSWEPGGNQGTEGG